MPEKLNRWDVAVIGGGIAGSAAAARLAQAGRKVVLLEKEAAAHDKVCGEFISIDAQRDLHELGLDLITLGAARISNLRLMRSNRTVTSRLPFQALSLSRRVLDDSLLRRAEACGARIQRGATVTVATKEPSGWWRIEIAGHAPLLAETVFLATGKNDLHGWHRPSGLQNDLVGFKLHVRLTPHQRKRVDDHIGLFLFNGGYGGLEPVEEEKANLCLVVTKHQLIRYGKSWDQLFKNILEATPPLADQLAGAEPCWPRPYSIFGIPYGFVHRANSHTPTTLYRLGDQMAVIPSFSGYGISLALYTARMAVQRYLQSDDVTYHDQARRDLLPLIRRASLLSKSATFPMVQHSMFSLCRLWPEFMTVIASHTRLKTG